MAQGLLTHLSHKSIVLGWGERGQQRLEQVFELLSGDGGVAWQGLGLDADAGPLSSLLACGPLTGAGLWTWP